jgi:hypothetical protein
LAAVVVVVLIIIGAFALRAYWPQIVETVRSLQPPSHTKTEKVAKLPAEYASAGLQIRASTSRKKKK